MTDLSIMDRPDKETRTEEIKKEVNQTQRMLSKEQKYQNELSPLREALLARYDQLHHLRVRCVQLETKLLAHRIVVLSGGEEQKTAHDRILDEELVRLQSGPLPYTGYLDRLSQIKEVKSDQPVEGLNMKVQPGLETTKGWGASTWIAAHAAIEYAKLLGAVQGEVTAIRTLANEFTIYI